jgi:hypothetical protein
MTIKRAVHHLHQHKKLTNAEFAFAISHIARVANVAVTAMCEGMWKNPEFRSVPAEMYALSVIDDLDHQIAILKRRIGYDTESTH